MGINSTFLLLKGTQTDSCFNENSLLASAECLQTLLEVFYGRNFTRTCPEMPLVLAHMKCRGCPWDKLNSTAVYSVFITDDVFNRSQLFHNARDTCSIADHARVYQDRFRVTQSIRSFGFIGPMLSLVSSAVLASGRTPKKVPFPLLMFIVWFIYIIGHLMLSAFEDYFLVCDSLVSSTTYEISRGISYAGLLYSSLTMCYFLQCDHEDPLRKSWSVFFLRPMGRRNRFFANLVCKGGPIAVGWVFFADIMNSQRDLFNSSSECSIGSKDIPFGLLQYAKILLELMAVTVYSFGPPQRRIRFYARYTLLIFLLLSSVILLIVVFSAGLYSQRSYSMAIPRVLDSSVAGFVIELIHVFIIACFGLLEPLRVGWPIRLLNTVTRIK